MPRKIKNFRQYLVIAAAPAAAALALSTVPAHAQDEAGPQIDTPAVVAQLFECRTIENAEARLSCFDRAVGAIEAARDSREQVIAEREQVEEARRGLFGLSLPQIGLFGAGDGDDG